MNAADLGITLSTGGLRSWAVNGWEACWTSRICKNRDAACNSVHVPEKSDMSEQSHTPFGGARPQCSSVSWSRSVTPNPRKAQIHCLKHLPGHSGPNPFSPFQSQSIPWLPCLRDRLPLLRGASQHLGLSTLPPGQSQDSGSPQLHPLLTGSLALSSFLTTHSTHPE